MNENYFKSIKSYIEEPSCSNYVSKEEEREAKNEDARKISVGPNIMILFGCSPSKYSKSGNMSTILESKVS